MQIAENVLVKLPSAMLLPEIRHTQPLKETKISSVNDDDDDDASNFNDVEENVTADEDMV